MGLPFFFTNPAQPRTDCRRGRADVLANALVRGSPSAILACLPPYGTGLHACG
jgi:hypothetical protein